MPSDSLSSHTVFRMPAEWEPHTATWLAWPHNVDTWPGRLERVERFFAELVRTIADYEPVQILAGDGEVARRANRSVGNLPNVRLHSISTNDAWIRDFGPTFVIGEPDGATAIVDWNYDAWGGKYPPFDLDQQATARIAGELGLRRFVPNVVLEGGAIDVNGRGSVLVTEQCLLDAGRNSQLAQGDVERLLADYLSASHAIWLGRGIVGDDTDGHVDQLARFVGPRVVVAPLEEDPQDPNYEPLQENWRRLTSARDQDGKVLEVIRLPMPRPIFDGANRLPASYANFFVINGAVLVPTFDDPADRQARRILEQVFPDRQVRGLYCGDLVAGLGGIHCITQQQPATPIGEAKAMEPRANAQ